MAISGGTAGLAGGVEIAGVAFRLYQQISPGFGFDAIAVSLLANNNPLGIIFSGILFGALRSGSEMMQITAKIPSVLVFCHPGAGHPGGRRIRRVPGAFGAGKLRRLGWRSHWSSRFVQTVLAATWRLATPLIYTSVGELFTERSGVLNIGLEGIMLFGAFAGFAVGTYAGTPIVGLVGAIIVGLLVGLMFAVFTVTIKANQIVVGAAINMIGLGMTGFLYRTLFDINTKGVKTFPPIEIPLLSQIPMIGEILFKHSILVYATLIVVPLAAFLLYRTGFGLAVRSVGEHPKAADTVGISVTRRALRLLHARRRIGRRGRRISDALPHEPVYRGHGRRPRVYCAGRRRVRPLEAVGRLRRIVALRRLLRAAVAACRR